MPGRNACLENIRLKEQCFREKYSPNAVRSTGTVTHRASYGFFVITGSRARGVPRAGGYGGGVSPPVCVSTGRRPSLTQRERKAPREKSRNALGVFFFARRNAAQGEARSGRGNQKCAIRSERNCSAPCALKPPVSSPGGFFVYETHKG